MHDASWALANLLDDVDAALGAAAGKVPIADALALGVLPTSVFGTNVMVSKYSRGTFAVGLAGNLPASHAVRALLTENEMLLVGQCPSLVLGHHEELVFGHTRPRSWYWTQHVLSLTRSFRAAQLLPYQEQARLDAEAARQRQADLLASPSYQLKMVRERVEALEQIAQGIAPKKDAASEQPLESTPPQ